MNSKLPKPSQISDFVSKKEPNTGFCYKDFGSELLQAECQNAFPKMNLAPPFVHLEIPGSISSRIFSPAVSAMYHNGVKPFFRENCCFP